MSIIRILIAQIIAWKVSVFGFSHIRTEYGEIQSISPYSVRMRENTDQNNSEYGLFLRSEMNPEFNWYHK